MIDIDKAIRAAKLTLGGMLEKRRAKSAVERAQGQIAPSKYLPNIPRQVHADGGRENGDGIQAAEAVAKMLRDGRASEITNDHLDAADPQHLSKLYETGKTGMELPMDHASRMERAKAMGFDTGNKLYHGTDRAFSAFDPKKFGEKDAGWYGRGVTTDTDPEVAEGYANYHEPEQGQNIIPTFSRGRHIDWPSSNLPFGNSRESAQGTKDMQALGYSGSRMTNDRDLYGSTPDIGSEQVTFDPKDVRSRFARFDPRLAHLSHLSAATGGRIGYADGGRENGMMGDNGGPPLSEPPIDLGAAREQKQVQTFHKGLMGDIASATSERMEAHQKALDAGVFDGYEVGDTLQGRAHPLRITARFVRPWKPNRMTLEHFDRMGAKPTIIEHNGKQYIPMLRYQTGKEGVDGFQEGDTYLDGVKAAGYQKMGGLRAVKADGGKVAFLAGNHPLVPEVLYHGTARDIQSFDPDAKRSYDVDPSNPEETDTGWFGKGHYFTASPKMAAHYASEGAKRQGNEGANVLPAHVAMKNPFVVDMKAYDSGAKSLDNALSRAGVPMHPRGWRKPSEQTAALVGMGHDGVIATREGKPEEYVAFHPTQIKSAISARQFDTTSPDITKADGGSVADRSPMFEGMSEHLRDETGKPLDLYHGTPVEGGFEAFDNSKMGSERDPGFYGRGHYLTPDYDTAEEYASHRDTGQIGSVMGPLHAALKNPFVWDMSDEGSAYRTKKDLETMGIKREGKMDPWDNLRSHEIGQFMQHMKQRGHDGVIVKQPDWQDGQNGRVSEIVVFNPNTIKHRDAEVGDPKDPRIMRADGGKVSGLYSKAAQIVRGMKDQKMDVADILKYAEGKGAKRSELSAVGVPPGKATPSEVASHMEFMQPSVGVHRREGGNFRFNNSQSYLNEMDRLHDAGRHGEAERLYDEFERFEGFGQKDTPRYAQYQLPGGENYREHVLTLNSHEGDPYYARNHWGKLENPLAHIRMSDRMMGNKKILHIEEMQSDWNNDARRQGFRTGREKQDYQDYVSGLRQKMIDNYNAMDASPMIKKALAEKVQSMDPYILAMKMGVQGEHNEMARKANENMMAPPQAPYINPKKDDWAELAMKHALTEAAKGGYDGVTFTPDEAQSERWGGTNFNGMYNKKLPGMAQKLIQQHDPETEDDMMHLSGWATPMIPLSEGARGSILKNGFASFRRGGYVTHVRSAR